MIHTPPQSHQAISLAGGFICLVAICLAHLRLVVKNVAPPELPVSFLRIFTAFVGMLLSAIAAEQWLKPVIGHWFWLVVLAAWLIFIMGILRLSLWRSLLTACIYAMVTLVIFGLLKTLPESASTLPSGHAAVKIMMLFFVALIACVFLWWASNKLAHDRHFSYSTSYLAMLLMACTLVAPFFLEHRLYGHGLLLILAVPPLWILIIMGVFRFSVWQALRAAFVFAVAFVLMYRYLLFEINFIRTH
jgi:hypothetical protein